MQRTTLPWFNVLPPPLYPLPAPPPPHPNLYPSPPPPLPPRVNVSAASPPPFTLIPCVHHVTVGSHTRPPPALTRAPGELAVKLVNGVPVVFPHCDVPPEENMLRCVYDHGPVPGLVWDDFDTMKQRVAQQWTHLPPNMDNIGGSLKAKINQKLASRGKKLAF